MLKQLPILLCGLFILNAQAASPSDWSWQSLQFDQYKLAYHCEGEGLPVVILENPSGMAAKEAYAPVYAQLAKGGKTCLMERLGYAPSDNPPDGMIQTVKDYSAELDRLVQVVSPQQPVVLVGYSYGGMVARHYAGTRPQNVAGLLLIDAAHEDWLPAMKEKASAEDWSRMQGILDWFKRRYGHDYWAGQDELRHTQLNPQLPVRLISRGRPYQKIRQAQLSEAGFQLYNQLHDHYQQQMRGLTQVTTQVIASKSEHLLVDSEPELVLQELQLLRQQVKVAQH